MNESAQIIWDSYTDLELIKIYTSNLKLNGFKKRAKNEYSERIYLRSIRNKRSQKK